MNLWHVIMGRFAEGNRKRERTEHQLTDLDRVQRQLYLGEGDLPSWKFHCNVWSSTRNTMEPPIVKFEIIHESQWVLYEIRIDGLVEPMFRFRSRGLSLL